jgi:hypothetical protein
MTAEPNRQSPELEPEAERFDVTSPGPPRGMRFGSCVGLFAGAAVGAAACLLGQQRPFLLATTMVATGAGCAAGGFIGARQMKNPRKTASPDIATCICVVYSLIPAAVVLLGGLGFVEGKLSGYAVLGTAFGIPMVASLIGAVLDRIYERALRRQQ